MFLWIGFFGVDQLFAQEINITQFEQVGAYINPSMTGNYNGLYRIGNLYRSQWAAISNPYITNLLFYTRPLLRQKNTLSAGLHVLYDQSGDAKRTQTEISPSISYALKLNTHQTLRFGLSPGISLNTLSDDNLTFPEQWDETSGVFNGVLPISENITRFQHTRFLLNTGLSYVKTSELNELAIGLAAKNIVPSARSFISNDAYTYTTFTIHGYYKQQLKERFFIQPVVLYSYNQRASQFALGAQLGKLYNQKLKSLYVSSHIRSGIQRNFDALAMGIGANYKNIEAQLSYDLNLSSLKSATNSRGGIEFSLIYTNLFENIKKITPNCVRM